MAIIHPTRRAALLKTAESAPKTQAKVSLNEVENGGQMLRRAIAYAGLEQKEAAYLCGVADAAQFSRMLDGIEKFPVHLLLRKSAAPILRELAIVSAMAQGECKVERVIRFVETAS